MLLALVSPSFAGLLINEVVYDPSGADDGLEWVELCNNGSTTIDLTGYSIETTSSSSYSEAYTFASGSIAPGSYVLVGYGSSAYAGSFSPNLANGTSNTSGVRIKSSGGTVVDTVLYATPNSKSFTEDSGTIPYEGAAEATNGKSLGRFPDCGDSNVSSTDFAVYAAADVSPGAANPSSGGGGGGEDSGGGGDTADCTGSLDVKINEIRYTTGAEYIEIYNAAGSPVALGGWQLGFGTQPGSLSTVAIPDGTTLGPHAFWVVGSAGASFKDYETDLSDMGNASSTDGVLLTCGGDRVDTLLYASANSDGWTDDTGAVATSLAPEPGTSESIARAEDGVDTDQCGVDFVADIPSPGISNTAVPVGDADCTNADGIKINEFTYATGAEWIELYNAGSGPVALDAWVFQFGTSSYSKEFELPDGVTLAAGDYLLVGTVDGADVSASIDLGNASNTDALRITCNGTAVDTVLYGSSNEDGWTEDSGEVGTTLAPKLGDGQSLARSSDGWDTDVSGLDFTLSDSPTPGAANPYTPPPVCEEGLAYTVKINEFVYNPEGSDTGNEWIEIVNMGDAPLRLDNWSIEGAGSDWDEKFTFPVGASIALGDFLVIGGDGVSGADFLADGLSIDNASSGAGGLRIVDCAGNVIDSVLYGGEVEDPISGDGASLDSIPPTGEGASLGRYPDGIDTNAAADWHPYAEATPGAPNTDPGASDGGGDGTDDGGGCGSDDPPKPGESGCATVLPLGGLEVCLAALALIRRRRR